MFNEKYLLLFICCNLFGYMKAASPTPQPSIQLNPSGSGSAYCPFYTGSGSGYYSSCGIYACPGAKISVNGCPTSSNVNIICGGDTSSILYNVAGFQVAVNNDATSPVCTSNPYCTGFSYTIPTTSACQLYTLRGGCNSGSCYGNLYVAVTSLGGPTSQPTAQPTSQPSRRPSMQPSNQPSSQPTSQPTSQPSGQPSSQPNKMPTVQPTNQPSAQPISRPSSQPTRQPTRSPTWQPFSHPTQQPTCQPTGQPSTQPTIQPSIQPTRQPTAQPTTQPTRSPTSQPVEQPSHQPLRQPSFQPTTIPSRQPNSRPSWQPTRQPTTRPSFQPTGRPTGQPTSHPSREPCKYCYSPGEYSAIVLMTVFGFACFCGLIAYYMGYIGGGEGGISFLNFEMPTFGRKPSLSGQEDDDDDEEEDDDDDDDEDDD